MKVTIITLFFLSSLHYAVGYFPVHYFSTNGQHQHKYKHQNQQKSQTKASRDSRLFHRLISSSGVTTGLSRAIDEVKNIPRKLKLLTSSSMEALLLKMTMPTNLFLEEKDIRALMQYMETENEKLENMVLNEDSCARKEVFDNEGFDNNSWLSESKFLTAEESSTDLIIRKLSSKLKEKDWRTMGKTLHILHRLISKNQDKATIGLSNKKCSVSSAFLRRFEDVSDSLQSSTIMANDADPVNDTKEEIRKKWLGSYIEYMQAKAEISCRGSSYMNDLLMMKGPMPIYYYYSRLLKAALQLLGNSGALPETTDIFSFSRMMSTSCTELVSRDVELAISELFALLGGNNTFHVSSFIEIQQATAELKSLLAQIAKKAPLSVQAIHEIPNWLNELTDMQSFKASETFASC